MFHRFVSNLATAAIRWGICITGRGVHRRQAPWLESPLGPADHIGAGFHKLLATRENLTMRPSDDDGLFCDFEDLRGEQFDPDLVHPDIKDFYQHTARYELEVWSEANVLTRGFLWALTRLVSRQMDQLNFPTSSLELSGGMTSDVIPMFDAENNRVYTGWLRRVVATQRVIYTGLYTTSNVPGYNSPCVKVSFPVPLGSATVFLRPVSQADGSFKLISKGCGFGDPGFYRIVGIDDDRRKVRYLKTLHEVFHVYVDELGCLRTEHTVRFMGLTVLQLHYKMRRKTARVAAKAAPQELSVSR